MNWEQYSKENRSELDVNWIATSIYRGFKAGYQTSFEPVFAAIMRLKEMNATHRKGVPINSMTPAMLIKRAHDELQELKEEPTDVEEMADILAILFHYCILMGWNPVLLKQTIIHKLAARFKDSTGELVGPEFEREFNNF